MTLDRKAISGRIFTLCLSILLMSTGTFLVSKEAHFCTGKKMPCRYLLFCITPKHSTGME